MGNGYSILLSSIVIGAGIAISGSASEITKNYLNQQIEAACWNSNVTSGLNDLVVEESKSSFKASYPDTMTQNSQDAVTNSLAVTLSNYAFTSASNGGGTIKCDAAMSFTYTRPDKTVYTNTDGNIVSYEVHPGQNGYSSEMSGSDIPFGVIIYKDDASAENSPLSN